MTDIPDMAVEALRASAKAEGVFLTLRQARVVLLAALPHIMAQRDAQSDCEGYTSGDWNTRSIPAAAAVLRANGWKVEEPPCTTCKGFCRLPYGLAEVTILCPTCNGTGKRKVGE